MSAEQIQIAAEIAQFVVENGRVTAEYGDWNESLRNEVEFECDERNLPDCTQIADYAAQTFGVTEMPDIRSSYGLYPPR